MILLPPSDATGAWAQCAFVFGAPGVGEFNDRDSLEGHQCTECQQKRMTHQIALRKLTPAEVASIGSIRVKLYRATNDEDGDHVELPPPSKRARLVEEFIDVTGD